ncbi:MAG: hypothetical protein U0M06_03810, partial [Clostridia bacterium]|nr:hypothetical protein [Clostridia bacterium]
PDEDNASDDFELDDVSNDVLSDDADFEFEAETAPEGEYDIELTPAYASSDAVGEFEFDDGSDIFGEEFSEPDAAVIDDFIPEDDSVLEAVSFENEPEIPEKKKKLGGLFGMGKKKGISLADGYAKMLEEEMALKSEEASSDISEAPSVSDPVQLGFDHLDEQPESKTSEYAYTSDSSMEGSAINETNSKISEFLTSDMPEIESISDEMSDNSSVSQKDEEIILESTSSGEPAPSQMFVFDSEAGTEEPEDEYFAPEKNPLAFDNDDDTPIVPDESAFADVAASDVSAFENEAPEEEISNIAENSEGLDDKDINLMLALGYEDELEKAIGKENVDVISDQLNAEIVDFIDVDNTYAFDGFELNSPDSFRAVGNKYKQEHSLMKLRLLGTGIFTAALFLFELLAMFGVSFGGALNANQYPVVAIMISLQFLVLAASMSWKQILAGLYDAVTFTPSPASIPSVALVMTVVYDIIMALISPYTGLQLYNFPAALCVLMLVLNDYFNLSREIRSFNTIATRRPKYAVSTVNPADKSAEEEMMYIFGEESDSHYDDKILEVRKVGFIDNYFRRSNIRSAKDRRLCLAIFPFIALSIALGVVSFVTNKNGVTAFNISILTVLFGLPMSALFTMSYPFFSAVKTAFAKDATIIGEESVEEYSDATSVKVADKEVFPTEATVTKGIKLYDNNAIYYVLYH